jgi:hypothetical protein
MIDGHGAWLEALHAVKTWLIENDTVNDDTSSVRYEMLEVLETLINGKNTFGPWDGNRENVNTHRGPIGTDNGWCVMLETTEPRRGAWSVEAWSGVRIPAPYGGWRYPWEIKLYKPFTPETW